MEKSQKNENVLEGKEKIRGIVRLIATDIDGHLPLERGLRQIKGISFQVSKAICITAGVDPKKKIGALTEDELKKVEEAIKNPKFPSWLFNRRRDPETGEDLHIVGPAKLELKVREDINLMKRIKCYKGIRHSLGLPVRGQRTRSSFRTQKAVGVKKKKK